jgi:integrase
MKRGHNPKVITRPKRKARFEKPYDSFPLTPYPGGWGKKIDRKFRHVCGHLPPEQALAVWYERAKELTGGEKADAVRATRRRRRAGGYTVDEAVAFYLQSRAADVEAGDLAASTFCNARLYLAKFVRAVGSGTRADDLTPAHFDRYVTATAKLAQRTRKQARHFVLSMLRAAEESDWIASPPKLGPRFRRMGRKTRVEEGAGADEGDAPAAESSRRVLTADEAASLLRRLHDRARQLDAAGRDAAPAWRLYAAVLLGLNGGYGPKEIAQLRRSRVDLSSPIPIIRQKRGKTGVLHRVPLWPEAVTALFRVYADAPGQERVFVGRGGRPVVHEHAIGRGAKIRGVSRTCVFDRPFREALRDVGITGLPAREGGMYILRHTHRSVSGGAMDEAAADVVVGHSLPGMRKVYQQVGVDRLLAVTSHVRSWLNPRRAGMPPAPDRRPADLEASGVRVSGAAGFRKNTGRRGKRATAARP